MCDLARDDVLRWLPPELELASATGTGSDSHPMLLVFGDQRDCAAIVAGRPIVAAPDYRELIIAVPLVRHREWPFESLFVARIYSTSWLTIWNGVAHYGFDKHPAAMWWQPPLFLVTDPDGSLVAQATLDLDAAPSDIAESSSKAKWPGVRALLELPVLGRRRHGRYVRSYFEWNESRAAVRAIGASASFTGASCPAQVEWASARGGAFAVRDLGWRLSWPTALR